MSTGRQPRRHNLEQDTPTDEVTVHEEEPTLFGSNWEPTFQDLNQFFGVWTEVQDSEPAGSPAGVKAL